MYENKLLIFLIYLLIVNVIGFILMGIDKAKAKKNKWRIPEKTLFIFALIGGSIGSYMGMYRFRHKTKHKHFVVGIPAILILQLIFIIIYTYLNLVN